MNPERAVALLRDADPAADAGSLELPHATGAAYLAAIQRRSRPVQTIEREPVQEHRPPRRPRWRGPAIAAAAAALIFAAVGGVWWLVDDGAEPPVATEVQAEAQSFPAPPRTAAQIALAPGRYDAPAELGIPFSFEVGDGFTWQSEITELLGQLVLARNPDPRTTPTEWLAFFPLLEGETVDSAMAALRETERVELLAEVEVTVGGAPGRRLDAAAPAPATRPLIIPIPAIDRLTGLEVGAGGRWFTESRHVELRFYALDVGGRTLLIYVEAQPETFDAFAADVEAVLASLVFTGT